MQGVNLNLICKCGNNKVLIGKHCQHTGIYCSKCGQWLKWANKKEINLYNIMKG